jgi:hypothetical protein
MHLKPGFAFTPLPPAPIEPDPHWIEHVQGADGAPDFLQLQYRQTVFLEFDGFFWPHVTVATLRKAG